MQVVSNATVFVVDVVVRGWECAGVVVSAGLAGDGQRRANGVSSAMERSDS